MSYKELIERHILTLEARIDHLLTIPLQERTKDWHLNHDFMFKELVLSRMRLQECEVT